MFGLFKFGKDVPKMIEDLIGIKGAGSFGDVAKRAFAMAGVFVRGETCASGGSFGRGACFRETREAHGRVVQTVLQAVRAF